MSVTRHCCSAMAAPRTAIMLRGARETFFRGRRALVLTVWQHTIMMGDYGWSGAGAPMLDYVELDRVGAEAAHRRAEAGVGLALNGGLNAELLVAEATGPVWKTIIDTADEQGAAVIVMGSRGRSEVASALLGSVSSHVVHHAEQPAPVVPVEATT